VKPLPTSIVILAILFSLQASSAQSSVEPDFATPQFHASAEERREQFELVECDKRADKVEIAHQDRMTFIARCLAGDSKK